MEQIAALAHLLALGNAVVKQVLGHAADAVAAHPALAAVQVEHAHLGVGLVTGADQDDPIAAHAVVPVAEVDGQELRRGNLVLLIEQVDVDIVVGAGRTSW